MFEQATCCNLLPGLLSRYSSHRGDSSLRPAYLEALLQINLQDRVFIVTGASRGLGLELSRILYSRGAHVVLACRTRHVANDTAARLRDEDGPGQATGLECDLSDLSSVRAFADAFLKLELPLHVLINNGAVMSIPFQLSKDGNELQFAVNHLAHHLLSNLLLDALVATAREEGPDAEGRILNISCGMHYFAGKSYDKNTWTRGVRVRKHHINAPSMYHGVDALGQSKLANCLHALHLAKRCRASGLPVLVNAVDPGYFGGGTFRRAEGYLGANIAKGVATFIDNNQQSWALYWSGWPLIQTVQDATTTPLFCALSNDVKGISGKYFANCRVARPSMKALDVVAAQKLWDLSEDMVRQNSDNEIEESLQHTGPSEDITTMSSSPSGFADKNAKPVGDSGSAQLAVPRESYGRFHLAGPYEYYNTSRRTRGCSAPCRRLFGLATTPSQHAGGKCFPALLQPRAAAFFQPLNQAHAEPTPAFFYQPSSSWTLSRRAAAAASALLGTPLATSAIRLLTLKLSALNLQLRALKASNAAPTLPALQQLGGALRSSNINSCPLLVAQLSTLRDNGSSVTNLLPVLLPHERAQIQHRQQHTQLTSCLFPKRI
ncbi:hypothetical protein CYMTET_28592 [Cymbomonas tetramitiformis]|uniref:Protochlorophyllide reductase n=1 Tax=Cymbomonas tetramitiformis TaxID=36881 RepID=A0AAE0FMU4_9CHLO|nr:hypothetical protein CYMTET_28592 [Cymbomonas tetramitiformis]